MSVRTAIFLAVIVVAGTAGDIMLTLVMKKLASNEPWTLRSSPRLIGRAFLHPQLWGGIGLMAVAFFAFITVLSWANVSFVVPATAANYIVGAFAAKIVLKEKVSRARWTGVLLVAAGVVLVCAAQ